MLIHYASLLRPNTASSCSNIIRRLYSIQSGRPNDDIVRLLQRYKDEEEKKPDPNFFRIVAFTKAIQSVSRVKQPIQAGKDALELRGIGPGIMSRIDEYLYETSAVGQATTNLKEIMKSRSIGELAKLPKFGMTTAKKLVEAGCHSVAQLRDPAFHSLLSPKQRVIAQFVGHIDQSITRADARHVLDFCESSLEIGHEFHLVGEFRRNTAELPEIHLMILHPDFVHVPLPSEPSPFQATKDPKPIKLPSKPRIRTSKKSEEKLRSVLHDNIIPLLQQRGLLTHALSSNPNKWEGIVRLPGPRDSWGTRLDRMSSIDNMDGRFRRMTIHLVPQKSRGASLLSLTGDSAFVKDVAQKAKQLGMLLNEYGLWKWTLAEPDSVFTDEYDFSSAKGYWSLLSSASEEEILDELGIPFVDPERRNFNYLISRGKPRKF